MKKINFKKLVSVFVTLTILMSCISFVYATGETGTGTTGSTETGGTGETGTGTGETGTGTGETGTGTGETGTVGDTETGGSDTGTTTPGKISFSIGSVSGTKGSTVTVPITSSGTDGVAAFTLTVSYSKSELEFVSSSAGTGAFSAVTADGANFLYVSSDSKDIDANGTIGSINFKILAEPKTKINVSIATATAAQDDLTNATLTVSKSSGTVTVSECTHANMTWAVTTPATCTVSGVETGTCPDCGHTETREIAATHTWSTEKQVTVQATCTTDGKKATVCTVCGAVQEGSEETISASHSWNSSYTTIKSPTCTTDGKKAIKCSVCGEIKPDSEKVVYGGHDFSKKVISAKTLKSEATTKAEAVYYYTCASCGKISTEKTFESGTVLSTDIEYDVTDGNGIAIRTDEEADFKISIDADSSLFKSLSINNSTVADINYTVSKNDDKGTDILVSYDYIKTLEEGEHSVLVTFTDGTAVLKFTVKKVVTVTPSPSPSPDLTVGAVATPTPTPNETSDPQEATDMIFNIVLFTLIGVAVIIVVVLIIVIIKRVKSTDDDDEYDDEYDDDDDDEYDDDEYDDDDYDDYDDDDE